MEDNKRPSERDNQDLTLTQAIEDEALYVTEEIEIEELAIDGVCGVY